MAPDAAAVDGMMGTTDDAVKSFYGALIDHAEELYDRAPCGYLTTAADGTILNVNQTFLSWTGFRREELVRRRSLADLLTPGGRIYHETHYAPMLLMHGSVREIALEMVTAGGERLPVFLNSVLDLDSAGSPSVVRTAIFDATERRRYEKELLRAKQRAEESERRARELVQTLQQTLVPPEPPEIPGLEVSATYRPAGSGDEVGGDFYDIFQIGPGDWVTVVGDVRGKGVEAAVVTALARYAVRAAAVEHDKPSEILQALNKVLLRHEAERFCTAVLLRLKRNGQAWVATGGCGGHPLPLMLKDGFAAAPVGELGMLLGTFKSPQIFDWEIPLRPGDAILLYTDGITEAKGAGSFFGEERLQSAAAEHAGSAQSLSEGILNEVLEFQAGAPRDDMVVVALQVVETD